MTHLVVEALGVVGVVRWRGIFYIYILHPDISIFEQFCNTAAIPGVGESIMKDVCPAAIPGVGESIMKAVWPAAIPGVGESIMKAVCPAAVPGVGESIMKAVCPGRQRV